jgi:hypothetical protein
MRTIETHATEQSATEETATVHTTVAAVPVVTAPAAVVREPPTAEQPVRVHIGRLEIRATIQETPPTRPPRRRSARGDALSLGDYLRGAR